MKGKKCRLLLGRLQHHSIERFREISLSSFAFLVHGKRILRLMVELEQVLLARNDISTVQEGANSIVNWLKKSHDLF